jgi:hypothetical protein
MSALSSDHKAIQQSKYVHCYNDPPYSSSAGKVIIAYSEFCFSRLLIALSVWLDDDPLAQPTDVVAFAVIFVTSMTSPI